MQLAVTVPSGITTTSAMLTASVIASFRDRGVGRSVVTAAGAWGANVTSTSRPRMSQAVRVFSRSALAVGQTWRDAISPAWPGSRLTINAQTVATLTAEGVLNLFAINDLQAIDAVASWTLAAGARRWTWTIDTPPDTALGFSLTSPGSTGAWDIEAVWSETPVSLPGSLL